MILDLALVPKPDRGEWVSVLVSVCVMVSVFVSAWLCLHDCVCVIRPLPVLRVLQCAAPSLRVAQGPVRRSRSALARAGLRAAHLGGSRPDPGRADAPCTAVAGPARGSAPPAAHRKASWHRRHGQTGRGPIAHPSYGGHPRPADHDRVRQAQVLIAQHHGSEPPIPKMPSHRPTPHQPPHAAYFLPLPPMPYPARAATARGASGNIPTCAPLGPSSYARCSDAPADSRPVGNTRRATSGSHSLPAGLRAAGSPAATTGLPAAAGPKAPAVPGSPITHAGCCRRRRCSSPTASVGYQAEPGPRRHVPSLPPRHPFQVTLSAPQTCPRTDIDKSAIADSGPPARPPPHTHTRT